MKNLKPILLVTMLVFTAQCLVAQTFQVPKGYSLKKEADYKKYEKEIIACINWLETEPIGENETERKAANAFLVEWLTGCPYVTLEINGDIVGFASKNAELLVTFMGGWTKFVLENPGSAKDVQKGNVAGLESIIRVYEKNKGKAMKKDKSVEELVAVQKKGELEKWTAERLKKQSK